MKLKVSLKDIQETLTKSKEQLWRSLEHFLENNNCNFSFDDANQIVEIEVNSKSDAIRLMSEAGIGTYQLLDNEKKVKATPIPKQIGRPKNSIFDKLTGKGMTINQYKKHIQQKTLSKAEIVKCGILTKTQLDTAIRNGELTGITVAGSYRILHYSLQEYIDRTYSS